MASVLHSTSTNVDIAPWIINDLGSARVILELSIAVFKAVEKVEAAIKKLP